MYAKSPTETKNYSFWLILSNKSLRKGRTTLPLNSDWRLHR